jgi:hypothetical protein
VSIFTLWKGKDEKNLPTVHSPVCSPALIALAGWVTVDVTRRRPCTVLCHLLYFHNCDHLLSYKLAWVGNFWSYCCRLSWVWMTLDLKKDRFTTIDLPWSCLNLYEISMNMQKSTVYLYAVHILDLANFPPSEWWPSHTSLCARLTCSLKSWEVNHEGEKLKSIWRDSIPHQCRHGRMLVDGW